MSKRQNAVRLALDIANDPSHGYDQANRWFPNFDCSSFLIWVWEQIGVLVKSIGGATYTGNMYEAFLKCGFKDVTNIVNRNNGDGMQAGDILLNTIHHTAMYIGDGKIAHASINERGTITGGQTGDQTGNEICVRSYYNFPWDYVLRYEEEDNFEEDIVIIEENNLPSIKYDTQTCNLNFPYLSIGCYGSLVETAQCLLKYLHNVDLPLYGVDRDFGEETDNAVRNFQTKHGLEVDGIVGKETWTVLNKLE